MIVISQAIVLNAVETTPDHPIVGWNNIVTPANIAADATPAAGFPVSNLANPATHREWQSSAAVDQHITVTSDGLTQLDYLAVARHNFGSARIQVSVEALISGVWTTIVSPVMVVDDTPILFRFDPQAYPSVRLLMRAGLAAPFAAVVYVGKLLIMEKRLWVGHVPFPFAQRSTISNGMSESGQFLGRIVLGAWRETTASFELITPAWYRANMTAFQLVSKQIPFFFAWRPASYPAEVGYGWLLDDTLPTPQDYNSGNLISFDLHMGGIV